MNGLFGILWGPLSDRFGRKRILCMALFFFVFISIVCTFAPNIVVLLVFRALQGAAVSATLVVGQGIIADIYPPETRGWYTGIFFVPFLIGPVIGPLIGGALSEKFGWRSTFVLLSAFSFLVALCIQILLPETHQYIAMQRFEQQHPNKRIQEHENQSKPHFQQPWLALRFLVDISVMPYIGIAATTFIGLFTSFTLFSDYLAKEPYKKDETIIGALFVPAGTMMLVGSLLGGWLSDKANDYFTLKCPEGRLVPGTILSLFSPLGLMIYGWSFHFRIPLAVCIIGQMMLSFGQSIFLPGVYAYITAKKQKDAAAASAANSLLSFVGASVSVTIAVPVKNALGDGAFFSILSGINIVMILTAAMIILRCIKAGQCIYVANEEMEQVNRSSVFKISYKHVEVENDTKSEQRSRTYTVATESAVEEPQL
ncbi:unnamed protein product [Rotaria sp. Silwood1]|nr:unnamed protein product [Rotaria sp. Silwood1]